MVAPIVHVTCSQSSSPCLDCHVGCCMVMRAATQSGPMPSHNVKEWTLVLMSNLQRRNMYISSTASHTYAARGTPSDPYVNLSQPNLMCNCPARPGQRAAPLFHITLLEMICIQSVSLLH